MSDQPTGRYSLGLTGQPTPECRAFFGHPHGARDAHIPECFPIIHVGEDVPLR